MKILELLNKTWVARLRLFQFTRYG